MSQRMRSNSANTENYFNNFYEYNLKRGVHKIINNIEHSPNFAQSKVFKRRSIPNFNSSDPNRAQLTREYTYPQPLKKDKNITDSPQNGDTPYFFNQKKWAKYSTISKNRLLGDTMGKTNKTFINFNKNMLEFTFTQFKVVKPIIRLCSGYIGNELSTAVRVLSHTFSLLIGIQGIPYWFVQDQNLWIVYLEMGKGWNQ